MHTYTRTHTHTHTHWKPPNAHTQTDRQIQAHTHTLGAPCRLYVFNGGSVDMNRSLRERFVDIFPFKEVKLGVNGASVHSSAAVNQNLQPTSLPHPSFTTPSVVVNEIPSMHTPMCLSVNVIPLTQLYYTCGCQWNPHRCIPQGVHQSMWNLRNTSNPDAVNVKPSTQLNYTCSCQWNPHRCTPRLFISQCKTLEILQTMI